MEAFQSPEGSLRNQTVDLSLMERDERTELGKGGVPPIARGDLRIRMQTSCSWKRQEDYQGWGAFQSPEGEPRTWDNKLLAHGKRQEECTGWRPSSRQKVVSEKDSGTLAHGRSREDRLELLKQDQKDFCGPTVN